MVDWIVNFRVKIINDLYFKEYIPTDCLWSLSVVDLSGVTGTLNLYNGNSNSTSGTNYPFGGLPNLTTVKLPSSATSLNLANFSSTDSATQDWTIQYGETSSPATFTSDSATFSGVNYNKISNETVEIKATNSSATINLGGTNGLFFGNSTLQTLKLTRTNPPAASGTTAVTDTAQAATDLWAFQLGTAPNSDNSNLDAAYASAPLGNNGALKEIEFSGFTLGNGNTASTQQDSESSTNSFNKITTDTWSQVASIMNLFSQYTATSSGSRDGSETVSAPTNLMVWDSSSSWIQADLTGENLKSSWTTNGSTSQVVVTTESETNNSIQANTTSATKTHNNIVWKYEKNSTSGEISITGTAANLYKSKGPGSSSNTYYQTAFRTKDNSADIDENANITVKLVIVPASTSSTGRSTK